MNAIDQVRHSVCDGCGESISITIEDGQKWHEVVWEHDVAAEFPHPVEPELRFAIDATCPGCQAPEIGYAPARAEFVCSRCEHTQDERPSS